jgi:hypothetical protein
MIYLVVQLPPGGYPLHAPQPPLKTRSIDEQTDSKAAFVSLLSDSTKVSKQVYRTMSTDMAVEISLTCWVPGFDDANAFTVDIIRSQTVSHSKKEKEKEPILNHIPPINSKSGR